MVDLLIKIWDKKPLKWGSAVAMFMATVLGLGASTLTWAANPAGNKASKAPSLVAAVNKKGGKAKVLQVSTKSTSQRQTLTSKKGRVVAVIPAKAGYAKAKFKGKVIRATYSAPPRLSFGALAGLHEVTDPLELKSSVALVIDQDTREVLFRKNESAVLPIASLTKLMTGLVISEARLPLDEPIMISTEDVDTEKGSRSRLVVGATLSRGELLHLALMSSENRAAHALGRTFPGGQAKFIETMNARARSLGMGSTRYVEPTGLSSANQSSAQDLALLVAAASRDSLIRELSTSPGYEAMVGNRLLQFNTTNALVKNPEWEIGVQKTGFISEAGQCLVMQAKIAGRKLIMVFLDSTGKFSRVGDAQRVKRWVEGNIPPVQVQSKNGVAVLDLPPA